MTVKRYKNDDRGLKEPLNLNSNSNSFDDNDDQSVVVYPNNDKNGKNEINDDDTTIL